METAPNKALTAAVVSILRPLVRLLLRHGVSYGVFSDLAKAVFVDVAEKDFSLPRRKQTISRISVLTGLTRKEVVRLQELGTPQEAVAERRYNRAARVVAGWVRDRHYCDAAGEPLVLPVEGEGASFAHLVRQFSGDIPPRAILDELLRVGAVAMAEGDHVRLNARAYIPQHGTDDKLHILGSDVALLIGTIDHNLQHGAERPRLQRKVAYDNLSEEAVAQFEQLARAKGQQLIEEMDGWLAQHDRDCNPQAGGSGRRYAGVGIYYFDEDVPEEK